MSDSAKMTGTAVYIFIIILNYPHSSYNRREQVDRKTKQQQIHKQNSTGSIYNKMMTRYAHKPQRQMVRITKRESLEHLVHIKTGELQSRHQVFVQNAVG